MIKFRRAAVTDALTIATVRQKAWAATYRGIYPDEMIDDFDYRWHVQKECSRLMNRQYCCYLVLDKGECVGYFAYGSVCPGTWKDFSFRLHSLYLLPAYQGTGLGRKIFDEVRRACVTKGQDKLFLDCHPDNHQGMGFYRHMGGIVTDIDYGTGSPDTFGCTLEFYFS